MRQWKGWTVVAAAFLLCAFLLGGVARRVAVDSTKEHEPERIRRGGAYCPGQGRCRGRSRRQGGLEVRDLQARHGGKAGVCSHLGRLHRAPVFGGMQGDLHQGPGESAARAEVPRGEIDREAGHTASNLPTRFADQFIGPHAAVSWLLPAPRLFVPVRVRVPDVAREHFVCRNPEVESDPQPVLRRLLPQDFGHGLIQYFHLPRIQSSRHVTPFARQCSVESPRQSYANVHKPATIDSGIRRLI